jgi:hypothetical protein
LACALATLLLALPSIAAPPARGAEVQGDIATSATWTPLAGPYHITRTVKVVASATLTVRAGAEVQFAPGTGLVIEGTLRTQGLGGAPVRFVSDQEVPRPGDWTGLLYRGATGTRLDLVGAEVAHAEIGVTVSYGGLGAYRIADSVIHHTRDAAIRITQQDNAGSTVEGNHLQDPGPVGVVVRAHSREGPGTGHEVRDVTLARNTIAGATEVGVLLDADGEAEPGCSACEVLGVQAILKGISIRDNTLEGSADDGILARSHASRDSRAWATISDLTIAGNEVRGARRAVTLRAEAAANPFTEHWGLRNVLVERNALRGNDGALLVFGTPAPSLDQPVEGVVELRATRNLIADNAEVGVRLERAPVATLRENTLRGNGLGLEVVDGTRGGADARSNYWGHVSGPSGEPNPSGQGDAIEADPGLVTSAPWLEAPAFNEPPRAALVVTVEGLVATGTSVDSTDADGTVAAALWDWGDGATSANASATHTYAAPGARVVRLRVTDDDGAVSVAAAWAVATPGSPNIELVSATVPAQANLGAAVEVKARLRNTGDAPGTQDCDLRVAGRVAERRSVAVAAGQELDVGFTFVPSTAGAVDVSVCGSALQQLRVAEPAAAPAGEEARGTPAAAVGLALVALALAARRRRA